jgi:2-polyprenyl-3-methyl-5-hydroxy-6-metoxy-1,4-benzoquinol methylase
MIKRLRESYSEEALANLYKNPYKHDKFTDHILRVDITADLLSWAIDRYSPESIADLTCGDGSVVLQALENSAHNSKKIILGDISKPNVDYVEGLALDPQIKFEFMLGKIEDNIKKIDRVDIFVATETLEHIDNPKGLIQELSQKTKFLLLSTPDAEFDQNTEHLWVWTRDDISNLLSENNFATIIELGIDTRPEGFPYKFQTWLVRNKL